eukprot:CAMPEP_0196824648 /NCGR_PEP_ID=MMETSP1362-20130617/92602_1 /TAXON_ID=163516 /ORGANISM="Leptocylindrus danicus, Strain CCMP1856" /LENGTH=862 /DNA_ID=CAMNT_0042204969 /DNA_START=52 /DNA_END=2640 /DNA_ORIENTATION=-
MRATITTAALPVVAILSTAGIGVVPAAAEIRTYSEMNLVQSRMISYTQGYISAPGYLDVSGLTFQQVDEDRNDNDRELLLRPLRRLLNNLTSSLTTTNGEEDGYGQQLEDEVMNAAFAIMLQMMTGDMHGIGEYVDQLWDAMLGNNTLASMIDEGVAELTVNSTSIGGWYDQMLDEALAEAGGISLGEYVQQVINVVDKMMSPLDGSLGFNIDDEISEIVGNSTLSLQEFVDSELDELLEEYSSIGGFVDAMILNVTGNGTTLGEFVEETLDEVIGDAGTVGGLVEELLVNATDVLGGDIFNDFGSIVGQLMGNATEVEDMFGFGGLFGENDDEMKDDDEALVVYVGDSNDDSDDSEQQSEEKYPSMSSSYDSDRDSNVDNAVNGGSAKGDGNKNKGSHNDETVTVEIAFVPEESYDCSRSGNGCELHDLGIGLSLGHGESAWCCSQETVDLGLCSSGMRGKLMFDNDIFRGTYLSIYVPRYDIGKPGGSAAIMRTHVSGKQFMFIANCGNTDVSMSGTAAWKSKHGYLPGYLWGEFILFAILTALYVILLAWYWHRMNKFAEHNIDIHKWLVLTILIGALEVFFKAGDFWVWNEDGERFDTITYTGVLLGIMKRAISRGLILMVSLGWGVVRESLGSKLGKIRLFCVIYIAIAACQDIFYTLSMADPALSSLSQEEENAFKNIASIFELFTVLLDVFIYVWIFDALKATIQHLETMAQHEKLKIMLRLRNIIYVSITFAVLWSLFRFVNYSTTPNILSMDQVWALTGAWEVNYFFLLFCVAILWCPNERSKEFAYAMELPSGGDFDDIEFEHTADSNELPDDDDLRWGPDNVKHDYDELEGSLDGFAMVKTGLDIDDGEMS